MNKIKIVEEVILKYERQKDGSNISLYKNELDNPPSILSSVPLKELIFNSLNSKSFRSIDEEYIKYILKDLELIQKELKEYSNVPFFQRKFNDKGHKSVVKSKEDPEFGFGDNV